MSEKLDNEVFKIERIDGEIIAGDANKLKLLITSYATIMEVQDAYINEEIASKEEEKTNIESQIENGNLNKEEVATAKANALKLTDEINSLHKAYEKFSESRTRFMELARKALKLPDENFKQLAEEGWFKIGGEKIELSDFNIPYDKAQVSLVNNEGEDVFSNVDTDAIKQEVERTMNEETVDFVDDKANIIGTENLKDYVVNNIDIDNFDEDVHDLANEVKASLDDQKENEFTSDDVNDIFSKAEAIATNNQETDDFVVPVATPVSVKASSESANENDFSSLTSDFSMDDFDMSNDPEIMELERQLAAAKEDQTSKEDTLRGKEKQVNELTLEKDNSLREAQEKFSVASEVLEKKKQARREALKAEIQKVKEQIVATDKRLVDENEKIDILNSEINGYKASIEKSEAIIRENGVHTK